MKTVPDLVCLCGINKILFHSRVAFDPSYESWKYNLARGWIQCSMHLAQIEHRCKPCLWDLCKLPSSLRKPALHSLHRTTGPMSLDQTSPLPHLFLLCRRQCWLPILSVLQKVLRENLHHMKPLSPITPCSSYSSHLALPQKPSRWITLSCTSTAALICEKQKGGDRKCLPVPRSRCLALFAV